MVIISFFPLHDLFYNSRFCSWSRYNFMRLSFFIMFWVWCTCKLAETKLIIFQTTGLSCQVFSTIWKDVYQMWNDLNASFSSNKILWDTLMNLMSSSVVTWQFIISWEKKRCYRMFSMCWPCIVEAFSFGISRILLWITGYLSLCLFVRCP